MPDTDSEAQINLVILNGSLESFGASRHLSAEAERRGLEVVRFALTELHGAQPGRFRVPAEDTGFVPREARALLRHALRHGASLLPSDLRY